MPDGFWYPSHAFLGLIFLIQMQTHLMRKVWFGGTPHPWKKQRWLTGKHSCILRIGAIKYVPILKTWRFIASQSLDAMNVLEFLGRLFFTPSRSQRRRSSALATVGSATFVGALRFQDAHVPWPMLWHYLSR